MRTRRWWRGLSRRRRMLYLAMLLALLFIVAVMVGNQLDVNPRRSVVPPQNEPGPVLLVPGYGGGQDALRVLADRIGATGRETRLVTLPGDGTGDLLAQVAELDREVDAALAGGAPSVDLIGYSAGGVVARLWVDRDGGEHRARRVITLGSPLHGTRLAASGGVVVPDACPVACQQLAPGSSLLASVDGVPAPLPWLSIWTENDRTVTPPDSARLEGAMNVVLQQVCPSVHIEHGELPTDPLVTQLVLDALGADTLARPSRNVRCPEAKP